MMSFWESISPRKQKWWHPRRIDMQGILKHPKQNNTDPHLPSSPRRRWLHSPPNILHDRHSAQAQALRFHSAGRPEIHIKSTVPIVRNHANLPLVRQTHTNLCLVLLSVSAPKATFSLCKLASSPKWHNAGTSVTVSASLHKVANALV
jgi:hypothetical protein